MPHAASLIGRLQDIERRQTCPDDSDYYHCGKFQGCCFENPCDFLSSIDPCSAAVDAIDGEDTTDPGVDGGGDDEPTSTVMTTKRTTTTRLLPTTITRAIPSPTSTKDTNTSTTDEPGSSTTDEAKPSSSDDPETTSTEPTSSSSLPSARASTTVDGTTTFSTSIISITDSTTVTGGATETETLPAPTPTSSSSSQAPPTATIAGVSVGGVMGGLALLLLLFWLVRRRRLSKRMPSIRADSPTLPDEKGRCQSVTGTALHGHGRNVFAEFGGRVQSHDGKHNTRRCKDAGQDEGWPLYSAPAPGERTRPIQPAQPLHPLQPVKPVQPVQPIQPTTTETPQPNSQPMDYVELDSTETERPGPGSGPAAANIQQSPVSPLSPPTLALPRRPSPLDRQTFHPSPLTPGFPGTQMAIQNRFPNTNTNTNGYQNHQDNYDSANTSANAPRDAPRATLNATVDERTNNLYANSWAHI
ncbi:hypothetical protein HD806DRAFT_529607 [Xylariaceae sp. AK1471]|nr:hypothetical protein HD806DRAFT_529607 [Xylariaceae sp. AK1471]